MIFSVNYEKIKNIFITTMDIKFISGIKEFLFMSNIVDEIEYIYKILNRVDKTFILIFDDVDRVNDIEKIEKILSFIGDFSNKNFKILVLYSRENLKKINERFDREYLEKYIPITREITDISFSELLKEEIEERKLDENDYKFLYILEKKPYLIYPKDFSKQQKEFKFKEDIERLLNMEIISNIWKITPRMIKNIIEESEELFEKFYQKLSIEKRIIIGYVFLKNIYYEEFYEKIDINFKNFVETFPIELKIKNTEIKITLEELNLLKKIISKKNDILKKINEKEFFEINDLRIVFKEVYNSMEYGKNHIDYYVKKLGIKHENKLKDKIESIEKIINLGVEKNIKTEELIFYTILNYPLYAENDSSEVSERRDKIEKAISKLKFLGNKEYYSAVEKFYRKLFENKKEVNTIEKLSKKFNEILDDEERNTIFYMFTPPYEEAMKAIKVLGTIEEQESFLEMILYEHKNIISDDYIKSFFISDIKKKEVSKKIINDIIQEKDKIIKKSTVDMIIENIERILYYFPSNWDINSWEGKTIEAIKLYLAIEKKSYDYLKNKFDFLEKAFEEYDCFIEKIEEKLKNGNLRKEGLQIKTDIKSVYTESVKKIKNEVNIEKKKLEIEKLFETGEFNFRYIRKLDEIIH